MPGPDTSEWARLPLVEQAEKWNEIVPGSAERMVRQLETELAHRRRLDWIQVCFQGVGALLGAGATVGYLWLAKYYLDHGQGTAGAGILGSGAVAAAGLFVGRRISRRD